MDWKKLALYALATLPAWVPLYAQDRGIPLFKDEFETHMTFAENWVPEKNSIKNIKSAEGHLIFTGNAELTSRVKTPLKFYLSMDLSFVAGTEKKDSEGGFSVENGKLRFFVKPDGTGGILNGRDVVANDIKIPGLEKDKALRLTLIRDVLESGDVKYLFTVNGKAVGSFITSAPALQTDASGEEQYRPFAIYSKDVDMTVDNFSLYTVLGKGDSPNRIGNSSFEFDYDGMPYDFRKDAPAITKLDSLDDYFSNFFIDKAEKHSGKQSLRLKNKMSCNPNGGSLEENTAGVFSLWMKSDREALKVKLTFCGADKDVSVGKEWQRYEVVNPKVSKKGRLSVRSLDEGVLWLDDLQSELLPDNTKIEENKTCASTYKPSDLDKNLFAKPEKRFSPQEFKVMELPENVKPGIELDAWKTNAVKLDHIYQGKQKQDPVPFEVYVTCDKQNLYVGIRVFKQDLSACDLNKNFVEAMIDPTGKAERLQHYQFYLGANKNKTTKGRALDSQWKGEWIGDARKNEETKSLDFLMTFPFSLFASSDNGNRWIMTFARYDEKTGYANGPFVTSPMGFLGPQTWPKFDFPAEIIQKNKIGVNSATYTDSSVFVEIENLSGRTPEVKVSVFNMQKDSALIGEKVVKLANKNTILEFPNSEKPSKINVKLSENNKEISNLMRLTKKHASMQILNRLSFYMNEPEAEFKITTKVPDIESVKAILTVAGKKVETQAAPAFKMKVPLNGVPDGEHQVRVSFMKDGKEIATGETTLLKLPFRNGATQMNRFSRSFIHNGKPIVPVMPFYEIWWNKNLPHGRPEHIRSWFNLMNKAGFNSFILLGQEAERTKVFMDLALEKNCTILFWGGYGHMTPEQKTEYIKELDYPNILWHIILDEPELTMPSAKALEHLHEMRKYLPKYYPVSMNLTVMGIPSHYANLEMDTLMIDDYLTNTPGRTVESVVMNADLMQKAGADEGKPTAFFLVGANSPLHGREPSYKEQMAQSYGTLAAGCNALAYFYGMPITPGNWNAIRQINQEMAVLTDILTSEEEITPATSDADSRYLRVRTEKYHGFVYLITCNIDALPIEKAELKLPEEYQYDGDVEVLFEGRSIPLKDGKFSDEFPAHTRHVYKVKLR